MIVESLQIQIKNMKEFFDRSTRPLTDEHSAFAPQEGLFTAAGQIAHVAQTIEWFFDAAFTDTWNMDFGEMEKQVRAVPSVTAARDWFNRAIGKAQQIAGAHTDQEWLSPFKPNPIMGEAPRLSIMSALTDHTAHHRGALTIYQRLLGLTPPMPYMDM
jgi:uncharacterized damage-inducible protein DinB